jgi:hexosaminidase
MQKEGTKSRYNLDVYRQVGSLVDYNFRVMQTLHAFDKATTDPEEAKLLEELDELTEEFGQVRAAMEQVYSQTRKLNKPEGYLLDQDHHRHPANQSVNFDWQFTSELMLLEKIKDHFKSRSVLMEGTKTRME